MLGGLQIAHRIFPSTAQIADRLIGDLWDVHALQIIRAQQTAQIGGVALIVLHAIARLARNLRRRNYEAGVSLAREVAIQPVAAGPGLVGEDEFLPLGLQRAHHRVDIAGVLDSLMAGLRFMWKSY